MSFKRWMLLVGVMTILGMAKVAQQTAVCVKAYDLGRRHAAAHALEAQAQWAQTRVAGLTSPAHLAQAVRQAPRDMVAWSTLPGESPSSPLVRLSQLLGSDE